MNRLFDLTGKTALVTGGSRGIGRSIALALAAHGAKVAINYASNAEAAEATARAIGGEGNAITLAGDVSQPAAAAKLVEDTIAAFGRIDIATPMRVCCATAAVAGIASNAANSKAPVERRLMVACSSAARRSSRFRYGSSSRQHPAQYR